MKRLIFRLMFGNSRVAEEAFAILQLRRKIDQLEREREISDVTEEIGNLYGYYGAAADELWAETLQEERGFWYRSSEGDSPANELELVA